jgi:uncharacterized protein (DUF983 family)
VKAAPLNENTPVRWTPDRATSVLPWPVPPLLTAIGRGLRMRCPACGQTHLFRGYLKVEPVCANCGAPNGLARADDAPPYFTIVIVGHVIVTGMWSFERAYQPPLWLHAVIWLPLTLVLTLLLLRPIKGATVGLMLKLGMLKSGDEA